MEKQTLGNHTLDSLVTKYKKWVAVVFGIYIAPTVILLVSLIGYITYSYFDSELRWHPYQQYVYGGYNVGVQDGNKDKEYVESTGPVQLFPDRRYLATIPWRIYKNKTDKLKQQALKEKDEYLAQFSESERGSKLAEMRINDIKLPLQIKLEKRFDKAIDFYTDYVATKVKRENYKNKADYQEALQHEAWKVGYEYGYAEGRAFGEYLAKGMR